MDDERVTLTVGIKDLSLLCMGLNRLWESRCGNAETLKLSKELARGKAYEDEIDEALANCTQELMDISDLYARLLSLR